MAELTLPGGEITVTRRGVEFTLTMQRDGRYFGRSGGVDLWIAPGLLREWIRRGVMTTNESAELDREVCEFLGIESEERDCECPDYVRAPDCKCPAKYPSVSTTWEGLGLVLNALRKLTGTTNAWTLDGCGEHQCSATVIVDGDKAIKYADTLPMALALAVQQLAKASA